METKSHQHRQSRQCLNSNNEKEKSAISAFGVHSTSHYQTAMMHAGISHSECAVDCPTFLNFVHMALLSAFQALHKMKIKLSHEISEEEQVCVNLLKVESSLNEDSKLQIAVNSFNDGFPQYITQLMVDAGHKVSDIEENRALLLSFVSKVLIVETDIIRNKCELNKNRGKKRRNVDERSEEESLDVPLEGVNLSECSIKLVSETKRHYIYCVSTPNGLRALKTTKADNPTTEDVHNLGNELKMGSQITYHAYRKSYADTTYQNKNALLLEWAYGNPLSNITTLTMPNFLTVAREIVSCLLAMHSNKVCHLNLSCDHIIFNSESNSIKIIGVGKSTSFCSKRSYNPKLVERDLRYISPEQTGRVNRDVDFRSDFYSLGIIFYRLLVGRHPFENESALTVVNMHIFHEIQPVHKIDPNIPLPLSDMLSKLIEKNVDLRYQSAKGIIHDIDLIISEYKPGVKIGIAEHDVPGTLLMSQKLYGRNIEYCTLVAAYDRILSSTSCEIVFIKGKSGMGKTALAMEFHKHVIRTGRFIYGKYDYYTSKPYSALIEAVKMFCDTILLEDKSLIAKYRSMIQDAVGEEGKLLTRVIENLHYIIGEQPEIFESFGCEAINRFNYVFIKFFKVIASISCPLVLVLEDLQWIDLASLDLITSLVESSMKNVMLMGVYRDNEVGDEHTLVKFQNSVKKMNLSTTEITVNNMDHECINKFISDTLRVPLLDSYPLTAFINKKTGGNPFFVKQMLNDLSYQKIITFSPEKSKWQWNDCIDRDNDIAENVLDLLRRKIQSLDKHAQQALTIASCLGSPFSLSTLGLIINCNNAVKDALATGMIIHKGRDTCCFVHDQVQHAANSLLPENPKPIFLHIARKLWALLSIQDFKENICVVVNLFDSAKDLINENERPDVAELFLLAGEKAMSCPAPKEAFKYFKSGIELLDKNCWKTRYNLSLNIHCNAAKSAYCIANYKRMRKIIKKIFKSVTNALDLVPCYLLLIRMNSDIRRNDEAIRHALNILEHLAIIIDPNRSIRRSELMQTKRLVEESVQGILEIREMEDRTVLSAMEILNYTLYSCFFSGNFNLFASVCSKMIELTMKHGISKYSCHGLCCFAGVLCNNGDKSSYEIGKLALKLLEKSNSKEMIPLVNTTFFCLISPYFASMHSSIDSMARTTCISFEIGLHHCSASCAGAYSKFAFFCGEPLSKTIDEICQHEAVLIRMTPFHMAIHQAMLNLHDSDIKNPAQLSGDKFDYKDCFDKAATKSDVIKTSIICCIIAYLFYDYEGASKFIEICKRDKEYFGIVIFKVLFHFYDGLLASSIARNIERKEKHIMIVEENILKLKGYAENAPMNFLNKVCLLEAELAAMHRNESQAKSLYQKAISLSKKYGFVNEEALACERFANFYLELESQPDATELLLQSCNCYKTWGATSKILHLIKTYPFLAAALEASTSTLGISAENLKVNNESVESISVLTDDLSSASTSTWKNQKRVRLSVTKCSNRQCE